MKLSTFKLPSVYSILLLLTVLMALLTWVIPAGQYQMEFSEQLNKSVPVAGTYQTIDAEPQGILDVLYAPIKGFYEPATNVARSVDVALFVLIIGGFFGVVNHTRSIEQGIGHVTHVMKGKEIWMIPVLMGFFALGGTLFGMAEETLPFYALVIPVMILAGYDALTGVAVVMIGAGIGALGSTINPFATIIASNAAQVSFTDGLEWRIVILVCGWLLSVAYVMRYAQKVKKQPSYSLVANLADDNKRHFVKQTNADVTLSSSQKWILTVVGATFIVMVWGVSFAHWWMAEMSVLFLVAAIVVGIIACMGEEQIGNSFVNGARELLGVAFIIALARGIVVIMDQGNITHTLLHFFETSLTGMGSVAFINAIYLIESFLSLLIPSSSGLAVLSMPVLAPLADFVDVPRTFVVTAYQSASGLPNLVTPTSAIVMGGLALGRVPYLAWLKFITPLLLMIMLMVSAVLSIGVVVSS